MNDPVATSVLPGSVAPAAATQSSSDADRQRVKQLAQEFEALLMTQMLREMRRSMLSDEEHENGFGNEMMTDTVDIELGRALSRAGGVGLSGVLFRAIDQRFNTGAPSSTSPSGSATAQPLQAASDQPTVGAASISAGPADGPAPAAPSADESDLKIPDGRVSSAFGWRHDPLTGILQFHRGIDVAQAYGQDVSAAAAGRVVFAGDHGAYGTMVVIDHPAGRQTRYAHLSVSGVRVGELVDTGQVIGKSGDSGRSTGPHLHFEVLEVGRAVDPAAGS